jgi:4-amino-4-deoxy-L-arabinose transferase-like glycosyltransferase
MRIARNLASGKGYSFDGINPTGGAPPLWTLITSLNHFFLDSEAAAKATIIESSLFGTASAILVFYIAYRCFNVKVAWGAFTFSLLSAPMFFNSMNGMETGLFTFLGLLVTSLYCGGKFKRTKGRSWYFSIGALLGLTNLARADGVFLAFAIILLEGVTLFKAREKDKSEYVMQVVTLAIDITVFTLPLVL